MTLALTRGGTFQDKLADSPERVALWQAPVPRRWPGGGHSLAAMPNPQTQERGFVFWGKPGKINSGLRERRPLEASLKLVYPSFLYFMLLWMCVSNNHVLEVFY